MKVKYRLGACPLLARKSVPRVRMGGERIERDVPVGLFLSWRSPDMLMRGTDFRATGRQHYPLFFTCITEPLDNGSRFAHDSCFVMTP